MTTGRMTAPQPVVAGPDRAERMARAEALLAAGKLGEARAAFRALVAEKPDDGHARGLLHLTAARELVVAGKPVEARAEAERALAASPGLAEARELLDAGDKKDGRLFSRWFRR